MYIDVKCVLQTDHERHNWCTIYSKSRETFLFYDKRSNTNGTADAYLSEQRERERKNECERSQVTLKNALAERLIVLLYLHARAQGEGRERERERGDERRRGRTQSTARRGDKVHKNGVIIRLSRVTHCTVYHWCTNALFWWIFFGPLFLPADQLIRHSSPAHRA